MDLDDFMHFNLFASEWIILPFVLVGLAVYLLLRNWLFRMAGAVVRAVVRLWRWCAGNPVTLFRWAVVVLLGGIFWCLCPKCKHERKKPGVRLYSPGMQNIRIE